RAFELSPGRGAREGLLAWIARGCADRPLREGATAIRVCSAHRTTAEVREPLGRNSASTAGNRVSLRRFASFSPQRPGLTVSRWCNRHGQPQPALQLLADPAGT